MDESRTSRRRIALAAICIACFLAGITWLWFLRYTSPESRAFEAANLMRANGWGRLYNITISSHVKPQEITREQFVALMTALCDESGIQVSALPLPNDVSSTDNQTRDFKMKLSGKPERAIYMRLVPTPAGWLIDDGPLVSLLAKLPADGNLASSNRLIGVMEKTRVPRIYESGKNLEATVQTIRAAQESNFESTHWSTAKVPRSYDW
jgi:hypothetical protein